MLVEKGSCNLTRPTPLHSDAEVSWRIIDAAIRPPVFGLYPGFAICLLPNFGQVIFLFLSEPQFPNLKSGDNAPFSSTQTKIVL